MNSYATNIAIGGVLPSSELKPLMRAVADSRVGLDWNEASIEYDGPSARAVFHAMERGQAAGEPLRLYGDAATNGRFDQIEAFCRSHGLSFRSESDPDHGETGMVRWWTPGMAAVGEMEADADGEPFVRVTDVVAALDAAATPEAAVAAVREMTARATPPEIGPLSLRAA